MTLENEIYMLYKSQLDRVLAESTTYGKVITTGKQNEHERQREGGGRRTRWWLESADHSELAP